MAINEEKCISKMIGPPTAHRTLKVAQLARKIPDGIHYGTIWSGSRIWHSMTLITAKCIAYAMAYATHSRATFRGRLLTRCAPSHAGLAVKSAPRFCYSSTASTYRTYALSVGWAYSMGYSRSSHSIFTEEQNCSNRSLGHEH